MLAYLVTILTTALAIVMWFVWKEDNKKWNEFFEFLTIIVWVIAIVFWVICLISSYVNTGNIARYKTEITQHTRNKRVSEERYEAMKLIVKDHVGKIITEVDMLKSFEPRFLLSLPQIRSNAVVMEQIKMAIAYQNKVFEKEALINWCKQGLDWYAKTWLITPRLISPKYEESTE